MRARLIDNSNFLEKKSGNEKGFPNLEEGKIHHNCEDKNGY
jgi:hypothetical protein